MRSLLPVSRDLGDAVAWAVFLALWLAFMVGVR